MSFGDWSEKKRKINDLAISNNGDRQKILATVASAVLEFTLFSPDAIIHAKGATPARTRLYQMGIALHFPEIIKLFHIKGLKNGTWETFKSGKNYEAFLLFQNKRS